MYINKCIICGKDFESKIPHKVTCSVECRKRNQANASYKVYKNKKENGIIKICETCGKEFRTEREESRFCSRECNNSGSQFKKERKIIYCLNCNKEIEIVVNNPKNIKFCCIGCSNTYNKLHEDVVKVCENCGQEFIVPYKQRDRHVRFCNKKCANFGKFNSMFGLTGSLSPIHGREPWTKSLTTETDERVAALGKKISITLKEKFKNGEISNVGENNPMYGKNHTTETREKISNTRSQKIINGEYANWFDKGQIFSKKMNKEISYRSSWELKVIEYLDKDESVIMFIYEPFSIPFVFEGVSKNYIPDVFVEYKNGIKKLIEIKPKFFLDYLINQSKLTAAKQYCEDKGIVFEVWNEEDVERLSNLGSQGK